MLAGIGLGELNFDTQISLRSENGNLVVLGKKNIGELETKIPWDGVLPHLEIPPSALKAILKLTRSFRVNSEKNMVIFEAHNFKFMVLAKVDTSK